jgi:uncharacterized protein (DUF427 family)
MKQPTPLAAGAERDYPEMAAMAGRVEPAPRRVSATLGGEQIFDTIRAHYVWEWPYYPQYYIPVEDVDHRFLVDEHHEGRLRFGTYRRYGLRAGGLDRPRSARAYGDDSIAGVAGTVRFDWDAVDAWFEEDEEIFVHPRNPYVRVDAMRSHRHVRVELAGQVLAESHAPVLVFETGLPTRYYFDPTDISMRALVRTETRTACPYKGVTAHYWSARTGCDEPREEHRDIAWCYTYPTRQLLAIAGLIAFFNERVDISVDDVQLVRPRTHFAH